MDDGDDRTSNPRIAQGAETIGTLIERRLSRRGVLGGLAASTGLAFAGCGTSEAPAQAAAPAAADTTSEAGRFAFAEITRGIDETHHVPEGYAGDVLIRWGDPLFDDSPTFDPANQSATAQTRQFGYNNDYIGFVPLEAGEDGTERGLLCVNHEYTSTHVMFPGFTGEWPELRAEQCAIEMAAHGGTVLEIEKQGDRWAPVIGSPYNRRLLGAGTPMRFTGPAAGHPRLKTTEDPDGLIATGTLNNCAGGITPWGTYLMAEENFHVYFLGDLPEGHAEAANHARYNVPGKRYQWGNHFDRYDLSKAPNEPNRYGWVVEVDPFDPSSTPVKRTAMGRFKHEGAESVVAPDGRVVIYMGDDQRFDYVYKFVTARAVDPDNRQANSDLLDEGTLYVARFDEDGSVAWLPLAFGEGPLTPQNGFASQADVMIETRRAADLLGATPMDRPEDVEPDPRTGRVYVMLTNNHERLPGNTNAANPRPLNAHGHIIEIIEPDGDFTATRSRWEFLIKCGDPAEPAQGAMWNPATSEHGWFSSPDNCAIDPEGRLWIATDGNPRTGAADGVWAVETEGPLRGTSRAFFRAPIDAEVCGPRFTPDGRALFLAVQHPGDGRGASFETPNTRWPDFEEGVPPRPSVVVVRRLDGGVVGS